MIKLRRPQLFALLLALSLVVGLILQQPALTQTKTELRGVWVTNIDSDVLFGRDRLTNALKTLKQLNFNTIYPTVWNWGYTLYPSPVAQKVIGRSLDPEPGLQGRDLLRELTTQGHKNGLAVIPWFEFGFMAPSDSSLAKRHPDWLTSRRDGSKIWLEGKHDRVWLNPFRPEVQNFIQNLIVEIVSKYDVDGVQFDDHFGLPTELGYDAYTTKLYKQEHFGKNPPANPQDPEWVRWRADKITQYLQKVFKAVKTRKPKCIISIAPNPQRVSYELFLADWEKWERQGLVEELVLQVYRNDLKVFMQELNYPEVKIAKKHIPVSIGILSGLKDRSVASAQIQSQVDTSREQGFAGVSFFFYETLWNLSQEKPPIRQSVFKSLFVQPKPRPNLLAGWKPE